MNPIFFETKFGKIIHNDSLQILNKDIKPNSVDLIMTSPPFGLVRKKDYGNVDAKEYIDWFSEFGKAFKNVLKENGSLLIDIGGSWNKGQRRRNWDCCSFSLFTRHASGHNPRPTQAARYRQRVMHKFKYFPERFGTIACVGCGRCLRACRVGQNLVSLLCEIGAK